MELLKEAVRLRALADDFNSERLGLKALLREQQTQGGETEEAAKNE